MQSVWYTKEKINGNQILTVHCWPTCTRMLWGRHTIRQHLCYIPDL